MWKDFTREDLQQTKEEFRSDGPLMQAMSMAQEVVLLTLGPDFWRKHCVGKAGPDSSFLRPRDEIEDDRYEFQDRVIRFGDMLFSLKNCDGFEAFLKPLRTNDLESVFFELWTANAFFRSGYTVRFVECSGEKGADYDLSALINGSNVAVEAKTRRLGENSAIPKVRDNLERARNQLPPQGPGVIVLSIPHQWFLAHRDLVAAEIQAFLRNTARVNHVLIFSRTWVPQSAGRAYFSITEQFDATRPRHAFRKNPLLLLGGQSPQNETEWAQMLSFW